MPEKYNLHLRGYVGGYDFDARYVDYMVERYAGKRLDVLIDSRGGDLAAGLSVAAAFRRHGDVHVRYTGLNASAATVAGLGAKSVSIDRGSMFLVHKASLTVFEWAQKNADQLGEMIESLTKMKNDLDKVDATMASYYARRCKKDASALLELMKVGGWLTPDEALEWGFVDEIVDEFSAQAVLDSATVKAFAAEGIPLPSLPVVEDGAGGLLGRLVAAVEKMFARGAATVTNQTKTYMNKVFTNLCALLACESIVLTDKSASLGEEQLDAIEQHMAEQKKKIEDQAADLEARDARIAELEAEIATLKNEPDDDPDGKHVVEGGHGDVDDYAAGMKEALDLFNRV